MILDKALLLKGLGGVAACTALGCGGTVLVNHYISNANDQKLVDLISKVGLTGCTNVNKECTIKTEGISVKQGESNKEKSKTKQTGGSSGKIKVYKDTSTTDYNEGFKFVIEDGDITLTGTGNTISKLEQFETYEIKKEGTGDDWYLTRKFTKAEAIKKGLGLPASDTNCTLPTDNNNTTCCDLDATKLKEINFDGKGTDEPTIESSGTVTLTISKETTDTDIFTNGYKFSFQPTQDVTISTSSSIKIKKGTNTEFKIKKEGNSLSLEKAWTVATLAKKIGLTNCDAAAKTCDLPNSSLNVEFSSNDKSSVTISSDSQSKKLKYEEDVADHNQGFKFFAEQEINLANGNGGKKIEASTTATYEIKKNSSDNKWYLTKKTTNGGAGG